MAKYRGIWIRRPLIWTVFVYSFGIILSYYVSLNMFILLFAIIILFFFILFLQFSHRMDFVYILIMFLLIGWLRGIYFFQDEGPLTDHIDTEMTVIGEIVDFPRHYDNRDVYIVKTEHIICEEGQLPISTKIQLTVYATEGQEGNIKEKALYGRGEKIKFQGRLKKPYGQRNPKCFDYRLYLKNKDIYYTMSVNEFAIKTCSQVKKSYTKPLQSVSIWMDKTIDKYVDGDGSAFLKSMLLGHRWDLPSDIRNNFSNIGTAHILAISGLHVGFIILGMDLILRRFYLRRTTVFFIQTGVLITYCMLIGAPTSAIRATIMAIISLGGYALNRPEDRSNSLAFAALIILLIRPGQLFDVGFQMSFGAVSGIILLYPLLKDRLYFIPKRLADILIIPICAQLGVGMLVAYHYNIVSPLSILANILFVPIAGLIVQLGFMLLIFALFMPFLAKIIGLVIGYLSFILIEGGYLIETIPLSSITVISPSIFIIVCYFIFIWLLSYECPQSINKKRTYSILLSVVMIFVLLKYLYPSHLKIVFVDVGQGDCIYIKTPDKKHILIDAGGNPYKTYESDFDTGSYIVVPFLLKNGVSHLDLVIASHWHDDHVGGLLKVLEDMHVDNFLYYPPYQKNEIFDEIMAILDKKDTDIVEGEGGQTYLIGEDVTFSILYPYGEIFTENENNRSIVIHAKYKDTSIMFTGDIEGEVERILADKELKSHILKVAHHGSLTSSTEEWIESVDPILAVIQVGNNSFGHPHPDVINRFELRNIPLYRTDEGGAVICTYIKDNWEVKTLIPR